MDDHWCTNCDKAINAFSNSLYCSEECLRADALNHHPLLGYDYAELKNFPHLHPRCQVHLRCLLLRLVNHQYHLLFFLHHNRLHPITTNVNIPIKR
ncbi:unnamed protein product [Absidia cylindrospora]